MKDSIHIAELIVQKKKGTITPDGQEELDRWIAESPGNRELLERVSDPVKQLEKLEMYRKFDAAGARSKAEEALFGPKTVRFTAQRFLRYAAAVVLPLLMAGTIVLFMRSPNVTELADLDKIYQPGIKEAVLVLSDGNTISLDPAKQFLPVTEQGTVIKQEENRLVYSTEKNTGMPGEELVYNQLRTPRGGWYALRMADGTRVWVNAASELRFPAAFNGSKREVYLEGEAYFAVTKTGQPFIVHTSSSQVRVLGTAFNISAYSDEVHEMTTLVEGRVEVRAARDTMNQLILYPNEQAVLEKESADLRLEVVDASGYISWMSGKLEFHNETLDEVMKKLARWYDFKYTFEREDARSFHFSARLNRDAPISEILGMLEMTTSVEFDFEDEVIVIR